MKDATKAALRAIREECDREERSTEYMIQYMQDSLNLSFDAVMGFLEEEYPRQKGERDEIQ